MGSRVIWAPGLLSLCGGLAPRASTSPRERALRGGADLWGVIYSFFFFFEHWLCTRHCSRSWETRKVRFLLSGDLPRGESSQQMHWCLFQRVPSAVKKVKGVVCSRVASGIVQGVTQCSLLWGGSARTEAPPQVKTREPHPGRGITNAEALGGDSLGWFHAWYNGQCHWSLMN